MPDIPRDWMIPKADASEDDKLGWLKEAIQQGESYLSRQRAYRNINDAIDTLTGERQEKIPKSLSKIFVNRQKRQTREVVATLSNLRPLWGYRSDNADYFKHAEVMNKMLQSWYHMTFADRMIRKGLQWAAGSGNGYISPIWQSEFWNSGRGDIALVDYGARDILPIQIGKEHDLQKAYVVIIRSEVPIFRAHLMYPTLADKLTPTRTAPGMLRRFGRAVARAASPVLNLGGGRNANREEEEIIFPVLDLYNVYVTDGAINLGPDPIPMGDPGTSWYYEVPPLASEIPTGEFNSAGQALYRKATYEDAKLYPLRRLLVAADDCVIKDDTSPYWSAKVPAIKFTMDDWPWEFLGYPLTHDGQSIQEDLTRLYRSISDTANARLGVPLQYDENSVAKSLMERWDPRIPNQHIPMNLSMGETLKPALPADYYDMPPWILEYIKHQIGNQDYLMGLQDITALAQAKQLPASDSMEKYMELIGPLVVDICRNMEMSMMELGDQWKSLALQFYGTRRRVQLLGEDGITEQDYDYEPGNMVPSHLPWEHEAERMGHLSAWNQLQRARWHQRNLIFYITPGSMHQLTQLTRKMLYLQLWRFGFPIDPWSVADAHDIPGYGNPPFGTTNKMERWVAWKHMGAELAQELQQMAGGPQSGAPPGGGRPPSGKTGPQMKQKGDGRPVITESR